MSKLFRLDGQRHNKPDCSPAHLADLRRRSAIHTPPVVAIPKYRVRGSYVEYVIECAAHDLRWHVYRRYQQFRDLDHSLRRLCPLGNRHHCDYGVLPVLSGSHWAEVTNQSADRVERRRRYLEIYLAQLLVPQNLFYVAGTALYAFLHDGAVPVRNRGGGGIPPLIGLNSPEAEEEGKGEVVMVEAKDGKEKGGEKVRVDGKEETVLYSETTPSKVHDRSRINSSICTSNSTIHSSRSKRDEVKNKADTPLHTKRESSHSEKSLAMASASLSSAGLGLNSENMDIEDIPSNDDTDVEDVRQPPRVPFCLQCNEEFSSLLYPHKCFSCKQRFCRNCLRRVELEDKDFAKACLQCYENILRHEEKKKSVKNSTSSASIASSSKSNNDMNNRIPNDDTLRFHNSSVVRTDVSLRDFILVTTIGRGTFGKVIKVIFREDGKTYAMKVLNKCIIHKRRMIDYIKEEKNILTTLTPHPYVVTCHFAFQTDYHLFFVLDYLPGGELYSLMYPKSQLSTADVKLFIAEIVLALEHLHRFDIVHRDLKPENIVLGPDGHVKLTDFGLARMNFSHLRRRSFVGSAEYLAPETIQGEYQTKALDWWSLGVMLFEMLQGEPPFHGANNNEVYDNILTKSLDLTAACFSPEAASLIEQLLHRQPKQRLRDPQKIKAHPYFASIDWEALEKKAIPAPIHLELGENDTRYFKREFTAEWAVIVKPLGVSRATLDVLTHRFGNFVYVKDEEYASPSPLNKISQDDQGNMWFPSSTSTSTLSSTMLDAQHHSDSLNPQSLHGVWSLVKVEMATADGKIAYPWGSEVCGLLAYFPDGLFTMQLSFTRKHRSQKWNILHATRDELVNVYNSYAASFGKYQMKTGSNVVVHFPSGSLCPSFTWSSQKYFIQLYKGNEGEGGVEMLKLFTAPYRLREDDIKARTVLTWERVAL
ncbi:protein kinase [Trypanosoma theileri]|uniref:Protein kinase n=1 Tax=Trypanosoma theileri TaxID=67003 RepID=A0A1X0NSM0_9TRYP|nr:protein kinase [Trypanosoma theileri]ORC87110.1 protein kinase [Trypanosoma theileri]